MPPGSLRVRVVSGLLALATNFAALDVQSELAHSNIKLKQKRFHHVRYLVVLSGAMHVMKVSHAHQAIALALCN